MTKIIAAMMRFLLAAGTIKQTWNQHTNHLDLKLSLSPWEMGKGVATLLRSASEINLVLVRNRPSA